MSKKLENARNLLNKTEFDGLISLSPENTYYLSNHWASNVFLRERLTVCAIFKDYDPCLIVPAVDEALAKDVSPIRDVKAFTEFPRGGAATFYQNPLQGLEAALDERNMKTGIFGIEASYMPSGFLDQLKTKRRTSNFISADELFKEFRRIKFPEEIECLKKAAQITSIAYKTVKESALVGVSERDLATIVRTTMMAEGADNIKFLCLGAGPRCGLVHNHPTEYQLQSGDIIHLDIGCTYQGYCSDLAGVFMMRKPSNKEQTVYEAMLAAKQRGIEIIRPGIPASEIFQASIEAAHTLLPEYRREHIGHGLGLEVHEEPILRRDNNMQLEPGMVLCVEHRPYLPAPLGAFHVEDTIVVTSDGYEQLTHVSREL